MMKQTLGGAVFLAFFTFVGSILLGACGSGSSQWTRQFGSRSSDEARSIAVDGKGNVYVVGYTRGTLPGQASAGEEDAFLRKYNANGRELWTRQFGTRKRDGAHSVAVDREGNVWVAGFTEGGLPGQSRAGKQDAFLRKYNADGRELWTHQFGTSGSDSVRSIAVDGMGNISVAGYAGAFPGQSSAGGFVRKYNADGNELWTRQFGTNHWAYSIAVDGNGNLLVAGDTTITLPGQWSPAETDAFVRKYDPNGNELWSQQFGTSGDDSAYSTAVDGKGNVYVAGSTNGTFSGQASAGGRDAFVRLYDPNGKELWTRQFGTRTLEEAVSIAVDEMGNVWVTGYTDGIFPGQSLVGMSDAFVRKYDPNGNELSTRQFGTSDLDMVRSIAVDETESVWVAGSTEGTFPSQPYGGMEDAFVLKYAR